MTKEEAIAFYRDACASKNTTKQRTPYGPGYYHHSIYLPGSGKEIAALITLGLFTDKAPQQEWLNDPARKTLIVDEVEYELTATEAHILRNAWHEKDSQKFTVEYGRTQF